jgi:hypothetical protein
VYNAPIDPSAWRMIQHTASPVDLWRMTVDCEERDL